MVGVVPAFVCDRLGLSCGAGRKDDTAIALDRRHPSARNGHANRKRECQSPQDEDPSDHAAGPSRWTAHFPATGTGVSASPSDLDHPDFFLGAVFLVQSHAPPASADGDLLPERDRDQDRSDADADRI